MSWAKPNRATNSPSPSLRLSLRLELTRHWDWRVLLFAYYYCLLKLSIHSLQTIDDGWLSRPFDRSLLSLLLLPPPFLQPPLRYHPRSKHPIATQPARQLLCLAFSIKSHRSNSSRRWHYDVLLLLIQSRRKASVTASLWHQPCRPSFHAGVGLSTHGEESQKEILDLWKEI